MGDKPPSRERYEEENPVVSFRVSRSVKEQLDALVDDLDMTKKDWFESVIQDSLDAYDDAYDDGFEAGKEAYAVSVPCAVCGDPVVVDGRGEERINEILGRLSTEGPFTAAPPKGELDWTLGHKECVDYDN